MAKSKKNKTVTFMDAYKSVRKAPVPATKVINPKGYDRKDKSWRNEIGY